MKRTVRSHPLYKRVHAGSNTVSAGYTYCALAALALLRRLPEDASTNATPPSDLDLPGLLRWLLSRQTAYKDENDSDDEASESLEPEPEAPAVEDLSLEVKEVIGFNGRCNKPVDTCYSFWNLASLNVRNPIAA